MLALGVFACTDDGGSDEGADAATETNDEGSCTPGTLGCECVEGMCFGGLVCEAGVCASLEEESSSESETDTGSSEEESSTESSEEESSTESESSEEESSSDSEDTGEPLSPCEEAELGRASIGCEYVMPIVGMGNSNDQCEIAVVNPNPDAVATAYVEGYINGSWEPLSAPFVLEPYDSDTLLVSIIPFRALRVSADAPVAVIESLGLRNNEFIFDAGMSGSLLHARAAWGTRYFGLGPIGDGFFLATPQLIILSLEPDTQLSFVAPADMEVQHSGQGNTSVAAFNAYEGSLGPADMVTLRADDYEASFAETEIVSSKPIAVFSYAARGSYPVGGTKADGQFDQLLPTEAWGTEHLAMPVDVLLNDADFNTWLIVASEPNTTVSFEGIDADPIVLAAEGDSARIGDPSWIEPFRVESSAPVGLMQFVDSNSQAPSMSSVPPVEHLANRGAHFAHPGPDIYNIWIRRARPSDEAEVAINGGTLELYSSLDTLGWTFDSSVPEWGSFALTHDGPFLSSGWVTVGIHRAALYGSAYQID